MNNQPCFHAPEPHLSGTCIFESRQIPAAPVGFSVALNLEKVMLGQC